MRAASKLLSIAKSFSEITYLSTWASFVDETRSSVRQTRVQNSSKLRTRTKPDETKLTLAPTQVAAATLVDDEEKDENVHADSTEKKSDGADCDLKLKLFNPRAPKSGRPKKIGLPQIPSEAHSTIYVVRTPQKIESERARLLSDNPVHSICPVRIVEEVSLTVEV
jgi:hypothetical protein